MQRPTSRRVATTVEGYGRPMGQRVPALRSQRIRYRTFCRARVAVTSPAGAELSDALELELGANGSWELRRVRPGRDPEKLAGGSIEVRGR